MSTIAISSFRLGVGMLVRSVLLGFAVAASLAVSLPAAEAREPASGPETLWRAFPFNPTGERIVSPVSGGVFRPPAVPVSDASTGSGLPLLAVIGGSLVALLALAIVASVLLRLVAGDRRGLTTADGTPSAHVSAVLIGTRWLPVLEGSLRRKRREVRTDIVPVLAGSAVAIAIALLIVRAVG